MTTVTTREVQHHFARVLEVVERGHEVFVTRRGRKVARLSPCEPENSEKRVLVPDFSAIRKRIGTDRVGGTNEILRQRGESG